MITEAYNLIEVLTAGFIGACAGGAAVFLATVSVRNDAAADRAEAAEDLAAARAAQIRMEAARTLLPLHPAYQAHTAQFEAIRDDEPTVPIVAAEPDCGCAPNPAGLHMKTCPVWVNIGPNLAQRQYVRRDAVPPADLVGDEPEPAAPVETPAAGVVDATAAWQALTDRATAAGVVVVAETPAAVCCTGHGDEPCAPNSGLIPAYCCPACPDRVPSTDLESVTAADLAPIGPDKMPGVRWWMWATAPVTVPAILAFMLVVALATLAMLAWDRIRGDRPVVELVEMELGHPAPAAAYDARHRAPTGRWWWSR